MTNEWLDIETAPKDGTQILAIDRNGEFMCVGYFQKSDGFSCWEICHSSGARFFAGAQLTHWQPLPGLPVQP